MQRLIVILRNFSLVLLDPDFGSNWKINSCHSGQNITSESITITFAAPEIAKYFNKNYSKRLLYVVSLLNIQKDSDKKLQQMAFTQENITKTNDVEADVPNISNESDIGKHLNTFTASFKNLQPSNF